MNAGDCLYNTSETISGIYLTFPIQGIPPYIEQTQNIYRTKITKQSDGSFKYEKVLLEKRPWEDKMYLYPILLPEQILNSNLGQNPGW